MRKLLFCLALVFLGGMSWAQKANEARYEQQITAGKLFRIQLHAGDYEIVPGKDDLLVVTYGARSSGDLKRTRLEFDDKSNWNTLKITDPENSDFHARIEVPRHSDLQVRMGAGDLRVGEVEGSKDIELHVGDLNIAVPRPQDYSKVDVSVHIGDVSGSPFNIAKSGFFRHAKKLGPGKYRLHAHVGVGDLRLYASDTI